MDADGSDRRRVAGRCRQTDPGAGKPGGWEICPSRFKRRTARIPDGSLESARVCLEKGFGMENRQGTAKYEPLPPADNATELSRARVGLCSRRGLQQEIAAGRRADEVIARNRLPILQRRDDVLRKSS